MLAVWDNLLLLSSGRVIYSGSIQGLEMYLEQKGFHNLHSTSVNPIEFALELIAFPLHCQALLDSWTEIPSVNIISDSAKEAPKSNLGHWQQVICLCSRQLRYQWKSLHGISAMMVRNIAGGLIFGMLYFQNGYYLENQKNIIDFETKYFTACRAYNSHPLCFLSQSTQLRFHP